jgi:hypothetical protein
MTEHEWLNSTDGGVLYGFLRSSHRLHPRPQRLLLCAIARTFWSVLSDSRSRTAVEVAEAVAEGHGNSTVLNRTALQARLAHEELVAAFIEARRGTRGKYRRHVKEAAARAHASAMAAWAAAEEPSGFWNSSIVDCGDPLDHYDSEIVVAGLVQDQPALVRELFGNPFVTSSADTMSLTISESRLKDLTRAAYQLRQLPEGHLHADQLAILADALEEAGCTEQALLTHLRGPGPHVRGCWALDLLTGKR